MSGTFLGMPSLPVFGTGNLFEEEPFPKAAHGANSATPSCGQTSATPPGPSGTSGWLSCPSSPTGRSCARRAG